MCVWRACEIIAWVHMHMCLCVQWPESDTGCLSQSLPALYIEAGSLIKPKVLFLVLASQLASLELGSGWLPCLRRRLCEHWGSEFWL